MSVAPVAHHTNGSLLAPLAVGACLLAGGAYIVADSDPTDGPVLCPYRRLTGLWCPGCGLSRATHYLFRGNIGQALNYHLFVIPVLGVIALSWLSWLSVSMGRESALNRVVTARRAWIFAGILIGFAVVRNLPGLEVLTGG